jgi:hypothetical protein
MEMTSEILDMAAILNRILERAAQNLTIEKLLLQLNLDPNNITFHAVFQRLVDVAIANINIANMCALVGAAFYAATFLTPTMVRLRVFGIISAIFFMAYGLIGAVITTFLMYLFMFLVNNLRLFQIIKILKKARIAAEGDLSMDWLKPFMNQRKYHEGEIVFRKGRPANEMMLITTGKFLVTEIGIELLPGQLMGELGFLTKKNKRTHTVKCIEDGAVLTISYDRLLEIYFEYPDFGYYFLRLSSDRLLQNNARLERSIEQYKVRLQSVTETNVQRDLT